MVIRLKCETHSEEQARDLQNGKLELIPGVKIPKNIVFTSNYGEALLDADIVFIMVAAKFVA